MNSISIATNATAEITDDAVDVAMAAARSIDPTEEVVRRVRRALGSSRGRRYPAGLGVIERTAIARSVTRSLWPEAQIQVRFVEREIRQDGWLPGSGTLIDLVDGPSIAEVEAAVGVWLLDDDDPRSGPARDRSAWVHVRRSLSPGVMAALLMHEIGRRKGRDRVLLPPAETIVVGSGQRITIKPTVNRRLVREAVKALGAGPALGPGRPGCAVGADPDAWEHLLRLGEVLAALADVHDPIPAVGFHQPAWQREAAAKALILQWRRTSCRALEALLIDRPVPTTTNATA